MVITQTFSEFVKNKNIFVYKIPDGTLTIKNWFIGTQFKEKSSIKATLYHVKCREYKKKKKWIPIDVIYSTKGNYNKMLDVPYIVNSCGNARIVIEIESLGANGKREVFAKWVGEHYES